MSGLYKNRGKEPTLFSGLTSTYAHWTTNRGLARVLEHRQDGKASASHLRDYALQEILKRGSPLLGVDESCVKHSATCDWMSHFLDDTRLVDMNIPGVHDAATGSYTDATRENLLRYTGPIPSASHYRCQQRSLFQMLNDGIRMFDMRYAYNPGNDTIGFYHSKALLAPTTTLADVLYGFYSWLDHHPTETILMSFNHEGGTGTPKDEKIQRIIYETFSKATNEDPDRYVKTKYWEQGRGKIGTLGESRGKMILLQRFGYDLLTPSPTPDQLTGIELGADKWSDNGQDIQLVYNEATGATAFVQDYYYVTPLSDTSNVKDSYISAKFNVAAAHLERAMDGHPDQLFINFASAAYIEDSGGALIMNPRDYALGDEAANVLGMNQRLLRWLQEKRGGRFGIILFDFYDAVPGLVEAAIGLGTGL